MYSIQTSERPGRPQLAVALSAGAMLLTVVMSAGLIRHKQQAAHVPLLDPRPIASWPLSLRLPQGWKAEAVRDMPPEVGLVLRETEGRGRTLAVVRGIAFDGTSLLTSVAGAIHDPVQWFAGTELVRPIAVESIRFGPLPGVQIQWLASRPRRPADQILSCAGVTPQRQVLGLLLRCPGPSDRRDEQLLRQLASGVELPGVEMTRDIVSASAQCNLRFEAPHNCRASVTSTAPLKSLRLLADTESERTWTLDVGLLPLVPGRTPKAVLEDIIRNLTEEVNPRTDVQVVRLGTRETARARLSTNPWNGEIWVVPLGNQSAVVLRGEDEGDDSDLEAVCRRIAETIEWTGDAAPLDVAAALQRGKELLADIRDRKVDTWFEPWSRSEDLFLIERGGRAEGYYRLAYARLPANRWRVASDIRRILAADRSLFYRRDARVDAVGAGYELVEVRRAVGARARTTSVLDKPYEYREHREAGSATVRKTVRLGDEDYRASFSTDSSYVCDPMLGILYALVAADPQRRPALITTSDRFETETTGVVLWPLGARPVPDAADASPSPAVYVQGDSVLDGYTVYFRGDGRIRYVDFGGSNFRRCTAEEAAEKLPYSPPATPLPELLR